MAEMKSVLIATAEHAEALSAVLEAQGRGPNTFTSGRQLAAKGTTSPVIGYLAHDTAVTLEIQDAWRAYCLTGDLPDIGNNVWGVDGIISAGDAAAARAGLTVQSVITPEQTSEEWVTATADGLGYALVPEPTI